MLQGGFCGVGLGVRESGRGVWAEQRAAEKEADCSMPRSLLFQSFFHPSGLGQRAEPWKQKPSEASDGAGSRFARVEFAAEASIETGVRGRCGE